jgi:hypothetical protein
MAYPYTKTVWVNNTIPAINETNLNKIEDGIYSVTEDVGNKASLITTVKTTIVLAINELVTSIATITSGKGTANGYASLGATAKVPELQLTTATTSTKGILQVTDGNGLTLTTGILTMAAGTTSVTGGVQLDNTVEDVENKALTPKALYDLTSNYARVYLDSNISLANITDTKITGFVVDYDPNEYFDGDTDQFIIPSGISKVKLSARTEYYPRSGL